jgi:hypothetical protein
VAEGKEDGVSSHNRSYSGERTNFFDNVGRMNFANWKKNGKSFSQITCLL